MPGLVPFLLPQETHVELARLLRPIVEEHRAALSRQDEKPPADLVQLVLDATKDSPEGRSLEFITDAIIDANRAGQATTASTLYHLVYDLAAHPECIEPLRDEIRGLSGEPLNRATVNKMSKLDSFIREAQRFSPFSLRMFTAFIYAGVVEYRH